MKQVYVARDPNDAHLLKGLLENEGVQAQVQGEWLFSVRGEVPMTSDTLPSVWIVEDSDLDRATEIVTAFSRKPDEEELQGESWQCSECGEQVEPQFTACWNCGAENKP
jgi:hypothetical protein